MAELLSFPGLGLEFHINRVAFTVAGMPIYWYGIIIALAFLAGAFYTLKRAKTFGLDSDRVMDVLLGCVLLGIVGARLYYVAFRFDTYKGNLLSIFNVREGGIAIYGGIIGGAVAAVLMCKWRRVKLLPMLDLAAGGLLLGQAVGRWGNFVNMEAFGRNTTAAWGMTSDTIVWYLKQNAGELARIGVSVDPALPVHPTFFYESMWCVAGFLFVAWFTQRRRYDGQILLIYLGWYGLGRFFIEGLRTDSLLFGTMRISQVVALLCVIVSALALIMIASRIKRANDPDFMLRYADTDEGKAVVAGTFYKKKEKPVGDAKEQDGEEAEESGEAGEEAKESGEAGEEAEEAGESAGETGEESGAEEPAQDEATGVEAPEAEQEKANGEDH